MEDPPGDGDSLLLGDRFDRRREIAASKLVSPDERAWADPVYAIEDRPALKASWASSITPSSATRRTSRSRIAKLNERYRERTRPAIGKYSLGVPFTERFFDLALGQLTNRRRPATSG